jgi:hypothetical protein
MSLWALVSCQRRSESLAARCALVGLGRPALDVGQAALDGLPALGDFGVLNRRFRKTVIRINGLLTHDMYKEIGPYQSSFGWYAQVEEAGNALELPRG